MTGLGLVLLGLGALILGQRAQKKTPPSKDGGPVTPSRPLPAGSLLLRPPTLRMATPLPTRKPVTVATSPSVVQPRAPAVSAVPSAVATAAPSPSASAPRGPSWSSLPASLPVAAAVAAGPSAVQATSAIGGLLARLVPRELVAGFVDGMAGLMSGPGAIAPEAAASVASTVAESTAPVLATSFASSLMSTVSGLMAPYAIAQAIITVVHIFDGDPRFDRMPSTGQFFRESYNRSPDKQAFMRDLWTNNRRYLASMLYPGQPYYDLGSGIVWMDASELAPAMSLTPGEFNAFIAGYPMLAPDEKATALRRGPVNPFSRTASEAGAFTAPLGVTVQSLPATIPETARMLVDRGAPAEAVAAYVATAVPVPYQPAYGGVPPSAPGGLEPLIPPMPDVAAPGFSGWSWNGAAWIPVPFTYGE